MIDHNYWVPQAPRVEAVLFNTPLSLALHEGLQPEPHEDRYLSYSVQEIITDQFLEKISSNTHVS